MSVQRQQMPASIIGSLHVAAIGNQLGRIYGSITQCDSSSQLLCFEHPGTVAFGIHHHI
jgi:hypothetical protein